MRVKVDGAPGVGFFRGTFRAYLQSGTNEHWLFATFRCSVDHPPATKQNTYLVWNCAIRFKIYPFQAWTFTDKLASSFPAYHSIHFQHHSPPKYCFTTVTFETNHPFLSFDLSQKDGNSWTQRRPNRKPMGVRRRPGQTKWCHQPHHRPRNRVVCPRPSNACEWAVFKTLVGCLIEGIILGNHMGIIINQYKDL